MFFLVATKKKRKNEQVKLILTIYVTKLNISNILSVQHVVDIRNY